MGSANHVARRELDGARYPSRRSPREGQEPVVGADEGRPLTVSIAISRSLPTLGSTTARLTAFCGMYGIESASRRAPDVTSSGRMRCERSTIGHCGAIPLITEWQIPTHSFPSPKSLRKTIGRVDDIAAKHARAERSSKGSCFACQGGEAGPEANDHRRTTAKKSTRQAVYEPKEPEAVL